MTRDLIDRAEALKAVQEWTYCCDAEAAIAALPAVTPASAKIAELIEWLESDKDNIHHLPVDDVKAILAALDLTPAPVTRRVYMGQIMAECDCQREAECEAAGRCIAEVRK